MAARKRVTGGCLCGAVRYEASVAPADAHYCHCRMCQRAFGNAFATFVARRGFCARCGTPLVFRNVYRDNRIGISIGSLDHPELAPPEIHWGIESIVPWLKIADRLPRKHTMQDPSVADAWTLAKKRARVRKRSAV
jgi:hypothetical protein